MAEISLVPRVVATTAAVFALAWSQGALAVNVPVLSVSVDGGATVSFENDQACDGTKAVTCFGTGAAGDLLISSFQLDADPDPFVSASFNFYNASLTNTISVVATVLFPMIGNVSAPDVALGTGLVNNVFGGGILDLQVEGFIDSPGNILASITEVAPGVPLTVCDDPGASPYCQGVIGIGIGFGGPPLVAIASAIGLRITFSLSPDTTATIGLNPDEDFGGGAFLSLTPQAVVPVPAAAWLLVSGFGALVGMRRRGARPG
jgi:hypothetical protein